MARCDGEVPEVENECSNARFPWRDYFCLLSIFGFVRGVILLYNHKVSINLWKRAIFVSKKWSFLFQKVVIPLSKSGHSSLLIYFRTTKLSIFDNFGNEKNAKLT